MERFYIGYGHASIGDCGSTTIFIECVSELVAKAIQDNQMYSGQQTSSRYVDLSRQPKVDPVATKTSAKILADWMKFYSQSQLELKNYLREKYPKQEGEDENIYQKAIAARGFDILRGFIPAANTTQLSWHTNLRQAMDKLNWLSGHPLPEARLAAGAILKKLKQFYPHSFSCLETKQQQNYRQLVGRLYAYYQNNARTFRVNSTVKKARLNQFANLIKKRPPATYLPPVLDELGQITFNFLLDYGSFRDIQRHRHGVCRMPLLTEKFGFNKWYLNQLPPALRASAENLIQKHIKAIKGIKAPKIIKQYYYALGFNVSCRTTYTLPAAIYVAELRSAKTVHPTLRQTAHKMSAALNKLYPVLRLYSDLSPDNFEIRRGKQDIVEKKAN